MQMNVIFLLPGRFTVREEEVYAFTPQGRSPQARRGRMSDPEHLCPVLWIEIGEPSRMDSWQDEHVSGLYGLDVHDRDGALVLVNQAHLINSSDQAAEQTRRSLVHSTASGWSRRGTQAAHGTFPTVRSR
jgi:hypothetical protein